MERPTEDSTVGLGILHESLIFLLFTVYFSLLLSMTSFSLLVFVAAQNIENGKMHQRRAGPPAAASRPIPVTWSATF